MGITTSNKMWGLVLGALVLTLILTSTVFVSGCADNAKQLCNSTDLSNCTGSTVGCYAGVCTFIPTSSDKCDKGYKFVTPEEGKGGVTIENTMFKDIKGKEIGYCVAEEKPAVATTTTSSTTSGTSPPSSSTTSDFCTHSKNDGKKWCIQDGVTQYSAECKMGGLVKTECSKGCDSDTSKCKEASEGVTTTSVSSSNGAALSTTSLGGGSGAGSTSFMNVFNSGIPLEILSSSLMKFFVIFLLLFAIVFSALETAKFPSDTAKSMRSTRFIIAAAFGLMGAVGTLIYPGLFPIQILATKFVMLLVIIVIYFILVGLVFSESTWMPNASVLTTFSRKFVAFVFFITMFTVLFLDTPVNMAIENHPVCQNTSWNGKICGGSDTASADLTNCLAVDYVSGSIVCCEKAHSSSVGKIGKYNFCEKSVGAQNNYFLSPYYPGNPTPDEALCSFDTKYEMPKAGQNMCATLGEFFIGPAIYRDYKFIVLQFLWFIAGILIFVGFYNRFHNKSWFWWAVLWLTGIFILLLTGWF